MELTTRGDSGDDLKFKPTSVTSTQNSNPAGYTRCIRDLDLNASADRMLRQDTFPKDWQQAARKDTTDAIPRSTIQLLKCLLREIYILISTKYKQSTHICYQRDPHSC